MIKSNHRSLGTSAQQYSTATTISRSTSDKWIVMTMSMERVLSKWHTLSFNGNASSNVVHRLKSFLPDPTTWLGFILLLLFNIHYFNWNLQRRAQPHDNLMQLWCPLLATQRLQQWNADFSKIKGNVRQRPMNQPIRGTIIIIPTADSLHCFMPCERIYNSIIIVSRAFQGTSKYSQHRPDTEVLLRHVWVNYLHSKWHFLLVSAHSNVVQRRYTILKMTAGKCTFILGECVWSHWSSYHVTKIIIHHVVR